MSGGVITDSFAPFEVHIYEVDAPGAASSGAKTAAKRTRRASVEYANDRSNPFSTRSIETESDDGDVLTKSAREVL